MRFSAAGLFALMSASMAAAEAASEAAAKKSLPGQAGILKELEGIFAGSRQIDAGLYAAFAKKLKSLKPKNPALYKKAVEKLKEGLAGKSPPWVRTAAWMTAGGLNEPEFLDLMKESLESGRDPPFVRAAIIQGAGQMGERGLPLLKTGAKDPHHYPRGQAMSAARSAGPAAFPLLISGLQDRSAYVFGLALDGIARAEGPPALQLKMAALSKAPLLKNERGLELLNKFHKDSSPEVRAHVALTAKKLKGGAGILKKMEGDEDKAVRTHVAFSAAESGAAEGLKILWRYAEKGDSEMRANVAFAVRGLSGKWRARGLELLEYLEKSPGPEVKKAVVHAAFELSGSDRPRALMILRRLKGAADPEVSGEAGRWLSHLESQDAGKTDF